MPRYKFFKYPVLTDIINRRNSTRVTKFPNFAMSFRLGKFLIITPAFNHSENADVSFGKRGIQSNRRKAPLFVFFSFFPEREKVGENAFNTGALTMDGPDATDDFITGFEKAGGVMAMCSAILAIRGKLCTAGAPSILDMEPTTSGSTVFG